VTDMGFYDNNNSNLSHLYTAFLGTQSALHGRGNLLNHPGGTPTSHQLIVGEETVMKPISMLGWTEAKGIFNDH